MQLYDPWLYDHNGGYSRSQFALYRPAHRRALGVLVALCAWALAALVFFLAELGRLNIVDAIAAGATVSLDQATQSDHLVELTAGVEIACYVAVGIAFLFWVHRIVANNRVLGALRTSFSPGYAVGSWFIPFADLVLPFLAIREAWRAADPSRLYSTVDERKRTRVAWYLTAWWVLFVLSGVVSYGSGLVKATGTDPLTALHASSIAQIAGIAVAWLAALFAMLTVIQLTRRQEAKASAIESAFAAPPQPPILPEVALLGVATAHLHSSAAPKRA